MEIIRAAELEKVYRSVGIDLKMIRDGGREQIREYLIMRGACCRIRDTESFFKDGIEFWRVHMNASHEFYEGVGPDGKMYEFSVGEGFSDTESEDFYWPERIGDETIWIGTVESPIREI
ncbi:MAG TPA: hypothetical protein VJC12_03240 [Candidatus Paceibacterota bacterium]